MTPSDHTLLTDAQLDDVLLALADYDLLDDDALAAARRRVVAAVGTAGVSGLAPPPEPVELPGPVALRPRRRHRVAVVLVAAAVLALVGVLTAALVQAARPATRGGPATDGAGVTCLVDPGTSSTDADARATALVKARLAALTDAATTVTAGPGRVEFSAKGMDRETLLNVCSSPQPSLRPLVSAPVPVTGRGSGSAPTGVDLPTSEAAYAALPAAQRARVQQAVAAADCAGGLADAPADRSIVVCDSTTAPTTAYLLGPTLVGADRIADATADAPNAQTAVQGWTVILTLDATGSRTIGDYTGAHHSDRTAATPPSCAPDTPGATPCADQLGIVVSGAAAAVPLVLSQITGTIQISGSYTRTSAGVIAAGLAAGGLTLTPA